jgi:hypothetical protein
MRQAELRLSRDLPFRIESNATNVQSEGCVPPLNASKSITSPLRASPACVLSWESGGQLQR